MRERGSTLIELLIVAAIIGIAATIVISALGAARQATLRTTKPVARASVVYQTTSEYPIVKARYFAEDGSVCETIGAIVIPRGALLDCAWRTVEATR